jgi:lipoprotein-anchoring transpeptidase ErfK/SrfK
MAWAVLKRDGVKSNRWILYVAAFIAAFATDQQAQAVPEIIISVPDQRLVIMDNGVLAAHYPVSTSKYGLGDRPRSYATPLGALEVAAKVGEGAPLGAVFKAQRLTGEILRPNSPGRDPIVTRILHLRGLDAGNIRAFDRGIYIHGTPEERKIGRPASYGCIRMRSRDVVRVFDVVPLGTKIEVVNYSLRKALAEWAAKQPLIHERKLAAN